MVELLTKLFPICRSITGDGLRKSLEIIKEEIPITIHGIESGEKIFDWIVPEEWNIKGGYIKTLNGETIVDFKNNNLHVVSYSSPINEIINFKDLKHHIHTLPDYPDWIPYRTSYYSKNWGFCMSHKDFMDMKNCDYKVVIDTEFKKGFLNYGELIINGKSKKEILLTTYICHPSMCNDVLSGIIVLTEIAKELLYKNNYYTYRILFIPETIGSIAYISHNLKSLKENVIGGYVLTCLGDKGDFTYLKTRKENQIVDKVTIKTFEDSKINLKIRHFNTGGSDERQFNYPGVDLNIGSLMKTKYHEFPEYHTSADDMNFISHGELLKSKIMYMKCLEIFENNKKYESKTICEPMLSKYNLSENIGGIPHNSNNEVIDSRLICLFLRYCDGKNDLIDISNKSGIEINKCLKILKKLISKKLLKEE